MSPKERKVRKEESLNQVESLAWFKNNGVELTHKPWKSGMSVLVLFNNRLRDISRSAHTKVDGITTPSFAVFQDVLDVDKARISLRSTKVYELVAIDRASNKPILIKTIDMQGRMDEFSAEESSIFPIDSDELYEVRKLYARF